MCRNPVRFSASLSFLCCINVTSMSVSDCVQFQSDHVQSGVPAGQGVCRPQRRHLGPERHQDAACGARDGVCRYPTCFLLFCPFFFGSIFSLSSITSHYSTLCTMLKDNWFISFLNEMFLFFTVLNNVRASLTFLEMY